MSYRLLGVSVLLEHFQLFSFVNIKFSRRALRSEDFSFLGERVLLGCYLPFSLKVSEVFLGLHGLNHA